ncbi:MAG TPA: biotin synthase BioB [Dissulfurispiraceae bacterium]|nr:biotin synthase BioB [Dissulfurispiraceae bacterium]
MINELESKVLSGIQLTKKDACALAKTDHKFLPDLFAAAERIRRSFFGDSIDICAIVNAKSGACPEDCAYCAQSSYNKSETAIFPFIGSEGILEKAIEAKTIGVRKFSIVTSGRKPSKEELKIIAVTIERLSQIGIGACASLGLLSRDELSYLRDHGLIRYHNNLETSERFFPYICTTHRFSEKIRTIEDAKAVGLSICSGGIFGMGETWQDRVDLIFAVRDLDANSMPINFLSPIRGTRLDHLPCLSPEDALKIVSLARFILTKREIRICGGRMQTLGGHHAMIFKAGADSLMTGNYLVTTGRTFENDFQMLKDQGLLVRTD